MRNYLSLLLAALTAVVAAAAQNPSDTFKASTTAVVVDVVVHDKQQRPVRGLTAEDFEVWEDGKRQEITSFVAVDNGDDLSATTAGAGTPPRAPSLNHADDPPAVAALVFHELGPEARLLAMKAGTRFVEESVGPSGFAGIFSQDFALDVVTPFTNNRDALAKGLRTAAMKAEPTRDPLAESTVMDCTSNPAGRARTLEVFNQLRGIISGLGHLPGRKAVVFFSEGIDTKGWLCDDRHSQFQDLTADANRARVAFYTFDAAGLRIQSTVRAAEGAPFVAMTMLAQETGGAFVESTNDLATGMARIAADLRQYYLLGYTPAKAADDKYRTIDVKLKKEGLTILARKGYRASRDSGPAVVRPAEVPALLLLDEPKRAESIPLLTRTVRMPEPDARGRTAVLASVPLDAVTFEPPAPSMPPAARLTLLARVANKKADVVHYAAETYDFTARPGQTDGAGSVLFFTAAALPPEPLTVDVVAFDALGQKGTVHTEPLSAPVEPSGDLLVGDLIIATRIQPRPAATQQKGTGSGLPFGDVVLLPNLGEPVPAGSQLVVAFQALADRKHGTLEASIDLKRNAAVVTSLPLRLPEPRDDRLIRFATRFSTGRLDAGGYVLTLTVRQDKISIERDAALMIREATGSPDR